MLGHKMFQVLSARFPETLVTLHQSRTCEGVRQIPLFGGANVAWNIDVTDFARLHEFLRAQRPDVVVNCVGMIKQRPDGQSPLACITLNALVPHKLAEICAGWGGRLIHFSTDCVFSGRKGNYTEQDPSDAEDVYGRTKFLGEVTSGTALTLRTSIIGRELFHRQSLLEWFLAQNHGQVRGFRRAFYSGVTTVYLSRLVADIVEHQPRLCGLYHVAAEAISKFELLQMLRQAYGLDIDVVPDDEFFCDRRLRAEKIRAATGYICPAWPDLVAELANDPTPYDEWSCITHETV